MGAAPRLAVGARNGGILERPRLGVIVWLLALAACHRGDEPPAFAIPGDQGPRILVEVLNASGKPGLARSGTRVLRRAGIDVVNVGNASASAGTLAETQILVRRGSVAVGEAVRRGLKVGRVVLEPDSTMLLDASVLLGADFAAHTPLELHP